MVRPVFHPHQCRSQLSSQLEIFTVFRIVWVASGKCSSVGSSYFSCLKYSAIAHTFSSKEFIVMVTSHGVGLVHYYWSVKKNFVQCGSASNRVRCCNIFHCCCIPDCSSRSNRERHLSFLLFLWRIKGYWSVALMSLGKPTSCWIVTRICSKYLVNVKGGCLYPDEDPSLLLQRPFICLSNNWRKPPRYWSASLGDEPVTIVVTTVRSWSERLSTCAYREVPGFFFLGC